MMTTLLSPIVLSVLLMSTTGNPIAQRRLEVPADPDRTIVVSIGQPEPDPTDPATVWRCAYHVQGIPGSTPKYAYGIDSLQAIQLAIEWARKELEAAEPTATLSAGMPGEHGISELLPLLPEPFRGDIKRYIDQKIEELSKGP